MKNKKLTTDEALPGAARHTAGARVDFQAVSRNFGPVVAADNLSFTTEPGEFLTLLGPSGSGKSTLLMLLAGFDTLTSGEIFIDGKPMSRVPAHARNQGIVFQSYALFPHMTVEQNLDFPLSVRGIPQRDRGALIERALDRVQMPGFRDRMPAQLSGGQQQRVALARAIVFEPPVLLMDEPLSALDRNLREEMQIELKELHRKLACTVLYVTHDQQEALTMSDRIAVLRAGKIVQLAPPREIYHRPADEFVAGFIGETNFFDVTVLETDARGTSVDLGGGSQIMVPDQVAAAPGQAMRMTVRPEILELSSDRAMVTCPEVAKLDGQITQVVFLGDTYRYVVRSGNRQLIARATASPTKPAFDVGEAVSILVYPPTTRLLPATGQT